MDTDNLADILRQITLLLEQAGEQAWAQTFRIIHAEYVQLTDTQKAPYARGLLRLYAGMGSFADLVLYDDGILLAQQTQKLDALRQALFANLMKHL